MKKQNKKKKKLHKAITFHGDYNTFIEAGWVENPTFKNEIYFMINSKHKDGQGVWFLRVDEALVLIEALARAVNNKITGINFKEK